MESNENVMKPDPKVIAYIEQFPSELRSVMFQLRGYIHEIVPDATEAIKWRSATFSYGNKPVCYIAGLKNHVTLAFHNGLMLRDPDGLLSGTGKYLRYIRFRSIGEIDEDQVRIWILEGFYV
jgi:hypothetical protein